MGMWVQVKPPHLGLGQRRCNGAFAVAHASDDVAEPSLQGELCLLERIFRKQEASFGQEIDVYLLFKERRGKQ
jgi:hypothetical protein